MGSPSEHKGNNAYRIVSLDINRDGLVRGRIKGMSEIECPDQESDRECLSVSLL